MDVNKVSRGDNARTVIYVASLGGGKSLSNDQE
jgi:hypothetical protein